MNDFIPARGFDAITALGRRAEMLGGLWFPVFDVEADAISFARYVGGYFHTVLDDAAVDWTRPIDYRGLVTRAVLEAPMHHTFVTDYAGPASILYGRLGYFSSVDLKNRWTAVPPGEAA